MQKALKESKIIKPEIMKTVIKLSIIMLFTLNLHAQRNKTVAMEQPLRGDTGRYVTKKAPTNYQNMAYTSRRRR